MPPTPSYTENKRDLADATLSGLSATTYTGSDIEEKPVVKVDGVTLAEGTDYTLAWTDNQNAGTATVTVTGTGNYEGVLTGTYAIEPADISMAMLGVDYGGSDGYLAYTGEALEPFINVVWNGQGLWEAKSQSEETDCTVSYYNNVKPGIATYVVTGVGNFKGTYTGTFQPRQDAGRGRGRASRAGEREALG